MAPELMTDSFGDIQAEYEPVLVDIYSFGVLAWAVLTKRKPYMDTVKRERMNLWRLREFIQDGGRPNMDDDFLPLWGAPVDLLDLVKRCWAPQPRDRPSSFEEVTTSLEHLQEALHAQELTKGRHGINSQKRASIALSKWNSAPRDKATGTKLAQVAGSWRATTAARVAEKAAEPVYQENPMQGELEKAEESNRGGGAGSASGSAMVAAGARVLEA